MLDVKAVGFGGNLEFRVVIVAVVAYILTLLNITFKSEKETKKALPVSIKDAGSLF